MAKEIKQKIVLSGEKEYNAALKSAQRELKTLQSALKAETAELGKNASEQDKNRVKAESLKKQIEEQEKIVKTLTEALAEVKEKYGDNEAEVAKWEQKLNNARATLAGFKNDLAGTQEGFAVAQKGAADAVTAAKSFADTLGDLGGVGDSVAGAIEGVFQTVIERVGSAVSELWDLISSTAAKANNWTDIAGYWNTDTQKIQEYARAVEGSANSFEDLQSVVSRLVLGGKGKKITELVGISDIGYTDQWQYAMDIMDRLAAMQRSGQNMSPILEELFGEKKSTKVMDLLNDWMGIQQDIAAGTFNGNTSGYGMSDEELQTMNDLWAQINKVETKWNALKENFAAGFGVASMTLAVSVEGALDGLAAYMTAETDEEREAALAKIRTNIEDFFKKVGDLIRDCAKTLGQVGEELQKSDDPMTKMIGDIFTKLGGALQWFVDNADQVKTALETIFGAWLLAKLVGVAGQLGKIVASFQVLKQMGLLSAAGAAGGAAVTGSGGFLSRLFGKNGVGNNAGTPTVQPTTQPTVSGSPAGNPVTTGTERAAEATLMAKIQAALASRFPLFEAAGGFSTLLPMLGLGLAGYAGGKMIEANLNDESLNRIYGDNGGNGGLIDTMSDAAAAAAAKYWALYRDSSKTGTEEAMTARETLQKILEAEGYENSEQAVSLVENVFEEAIKGLDVDGLVAKMELNHPEIFGGVTRNQDPELMRAQAEAARQAAQQAAAGQNEQAAARAAEEARAAAERAQEAAIEKMVDEWVEQTLHPETEREDPRQIWSQEANLAVIEGRLLQAAEEQAAQVQEIAGTIMDVIRENNGFPGEKKTDPDDWRTAADALTEAVENSFLGKPEGFRNEASEEKPEGWREAEDFWDAWRAFAQDSSDENEARFDEAYEKLAGIWGGEDSPMFTKLDELTEQLKNSTPDMSWTGIEDLPTDWWRVLNSGTWSGNDGSRSGKADGNGITGADLRNFQQLPSGMKSAVQEGARAGVSGIRVTLDGAAVGRLVAPYVSEYIAREMFL